VTDAVADRLSLSDRAYEQLKARLMDGQIEPGSRLVIDRLVTDLGVSQTPLREALARLEAEGLVVKTTNRGYRSAPLIDAPRMLQLFEIRMILEPAAAELAVDRADEKLITRLTRTVRAMERAPRGGVYEEYRQVAEADAAFHKAIMEASGNIYLSEVYQRLHAHQQTARLYTRSGAPGVPEAVTEHRAVLEALRGHDALAAAEAMRAHLQLSRARLFAMLDPSLRHQPQRGS
jgi:DNA-binding GntR family transcriptional regulator